MCTDSLDAALQEKDICPTFKHYKFNSGEKVNTLGSSIFWCAVKVCDALPAL